MGGAPDEVQIVAFMRAETGAAFVSARTLVSVASGRAERARLRDQVFPHERDQIVRKICVRSARTCGPDSQRFRDRPQTPRRPTQDIDSHGVSDPSGHAQGHFQRAHRGRSRHGFLL
jgi:hypothetical protein